MSNSYQKSAGVIPPAVNQGSSNNSYWYSSGLPSSLPTASAAAAARASISTFSNSIIPEILIAQVSSSAVNSTSSRAFYYASAFAQDKRWCIRLSGIIGSTHECQVTSGTSLTCPLSEILGMNGLIPGFDYTQELLYECSRSAFNSTLIPTLTTLASVSEVNTDSTQLFHKIVSKSTSSSGISDIENGIASFIPLINSVLPLAGHTRGGSILTITGIGVSTIDACRFRTFASEGASYSDREEYIVRATISTQSHSTSDITDTDTDTDTDSTLVTTVTCITPAVRSAGRATLDFSVGGKMWVSAAGRSDITGTSTSSGGYDASSFHFYVSPLVQLASSLLSEGHIVVLGSNFPVEMDAVCRLGVSKHASPASSASTSAPQEIVYMVVPAEIRSHARLQCVSSSSLLIHQDKMAMKFAYLSSVEVSFNGIEFIPVSIGSDITSHALLASSSGNGLLASSSGNGNSGSNSDSGLDSDTDAASSSSSTLTILSLLDAAIHADSITTTGSKSGLTLSLSSRATLTLGSKVDIQPPTVIISDIHSSGLLTQEQLSSLTSLRPTVTRAMQCNGNDTIFLPFIHGVLARQSAKYACIFNGIYSSVAVRVGSTGGSNEDTRTNGDSSTSTIVPGLACTIPASRPGIFELSIAEIEIETETDVSITSTTLSPSTSSSSSTVRTVVVEMARRVEISCLANPKIFGSEALLSMDMPTGKTKLSFGGLNLLPSTDYWCIISSRSSISSISSIPSGTGFGTGFGSQDTYAYTYSAKAQIPGINRLECIFDSALVAGLHHISVSIGQTQTQLLYSINACITEESLVLGSKLSDLSISTYDKDKHTECSEGLRARRNTTAIGTGTIGGSIARSVEGKEVKVHDMRMLEPRMGLTTQSTTLDIRASDIRTGRVYECVFTYDNASSVAAYQASRAYILGLERAGYMHSKLSDVYYTQGIVISANRISCPTPVSVSSGTIGSAMKSEIRPGNFSVSLQSGIRANPIAVREYVNM